MTLLSVVGSLQLGLQGLATFLEVTVFSSCWFSSKQMWQSRGCSNLTSTNRLIALAAVIGFVSHFGQCFFYSPFIFLGLLSWYLALPIQILKLSVVCMSGSFSLSYPLPEGEFYVGCSMPFARASFGECF